MNRNALVIAFMVAIFLWGFGFGILITRHAYEEPRIVTVRKDGGVVGVDWEHCPNGFCLRGNYNSNLEMPPDVPGTYTFHVPAGVTQMQILVTPAGGSCNP